MWVWGLVFFGVALYRLRKQRGHIGSAASGTIYDLVQEEQPNAIESIVADKASAADFEHADEDEEPRLRR